jgi:hypothetical protein
MRCTQHTRNGHRCTRNALKGQELCASHAGRCGARPGNQNALKHGRYSERLHQLFPDLSVTDAEESLATEIALTRELIIKILTPPPPKAKRGDDHQDSEAAAGPNPEAVVQLPVEAFSRLMDVLVKALKLDRTLRGEQANDLATRLAAALEAVGEELGIHD